MEDDAIRERTCALHRELLDDGLPAGLTLQARRLRTPRDLEWAVRQRTSLRLVKGPSGARAGPSRPRAHRRGLSGGGRDHAVAAGARGGFLPVFGTHDDRLAGALMALARERGWAPDEFEFEMLYGVRTDWQLALRAMGYNLRVYLPFGADWWPYAIRRVGSIPQRMAVGAILNSDGYAAGQG